MEAKTQVQTLTEVARLKLKNAELDYELRMHKDCTLVAILLMSLFAGAMGFILGAWLL